jgi:rubrerythrin
MKLSESNTMVNLATAFANECQEGAKYQFLREKAEAEGYENIGKICQEHATNEMTHARIFYDFITDDGKDCVPNIDISAGYPFKSGPLIQTLKLIAGDELNQATVIYPNFAQIAKDEGFAEIGKKFELIAEVERSHYLTLEQLYAKMEKDCLYSSEKAIQWKCMECGHEDTKKTPWQVCPICRSKQGDIEIPLQF